MTITSCTGRRCAPGYGIAFTDVSRARDFPGQRLLPDLPIPPLPVWLTTIAKFTAAPEIPRYSTFSPDAAAGVGHHIVTQSGGYIFFMKAPFNGAMSMF